MYDFRTLSPLDFEELVRDLLQEELGIRFESFGSGRDLGIDFRFASASDKIIIQAKHYSDSDALVRAVRHENKKVAKLAATRYVLATSASLTPMLKNRLREAMPDAPLDFSDIIGRADLNNMIGRHPDVEKKHFKLWLASTAVLQRILHSGVYNRTQAEMELIQSIVPKFVNNESVAESQRILNKHHALIIAGEPGVGKSTLARMLVWLHAEQAWKIVVIDDIKEAFEMITEGEKTLVFFDDFLGQVRLTSDIVRGMDQRFPPFLHKVRTSKNIRFVLTTRDYILHQAQAQSSRLSTPAVYSTEFILNVGTYTRLIRAQMLFNHIYFSDLSEEERRDLIRDDYYLKMIDHRNFNPRLIDLLTSGDYVSIAGMPVRSVVESILEHPHELWEKPYRSHISEEGRALMLALFFNFGLVPLDALERSFVRMVIAMGFAISQGDISTKFRAALKELEGSVVAIRDRGVAFSNPGVRDFLQRAIIVDKFLGSAIGVVTEFGEVSQAWEMFQSKEISKEVKTSVGSQWPRAAMRLEQDGSGDALRRVHIIIQMYDELREEDFIEPLRLALSDLEQEGLNEADSYLGRQVVEQLCLSLLPGDILADARTIVSRAVATLLADYGGSLQLDELKSLSRTLLEYGADAEAASEATRMGLGAYIEEIDNELDEIQSIDELDRYETDLRTLVRDYSIFSQRMSKQIEIRRNRLFEKELETFQPLAVSKRPTILDSDEIIKSMFSSLMPRR